MGAFQGVQNSQLQALQGQTSGDLYYLQLVGDMSARGPGRMDLGGREKGGLDMVMGEGNGDAQVEGKVSRRPLFSFSPTYIAAESLAEGGRSTSNQSHQRNHRRHPDMDAPIPRPP